LDLDVKFLLNLEIDDQVAQARLGKRLVHSPSGRNYNTVTNPPKVEGLDDVTGEPLVRREEDSEERIKKRFADW
jgi:adenylate kinase